MATNTTHYNLEKPAQSDLYNVDVFNDNADKIDTALWGKSDASNLAVVEPTNTASKPYVVGEYLVLNGILYKVTQAIANGGALVVGTNIAQDSVGTELKSIKESLSPIEAIVKRVMISPSSPQEISIGQTYCSFVLIGFLQGVGSTAVLVKCNSSTASPYDLTNGTAWTDSRLTFTFSNQTLKIFTSISNNSIFTVIAG